MGWMWVWPLLVLVGLAILGYVTVRLAQGGRSVSRVDLETAQTWPLA